MLRDEDWDASEQYRSMPSSPIENWELRVELKSQKIGGRAKGEGEELRQKSNNPRPSPPPQKNTNF